MAELREGLVETLKGVAGTVQKAIEGKLKDVEVVDAGDVEVVRFSNAVIVSLPKGKDEFFIIKGKGFLPPKVQRLSEVV